MKDSETPQTDNAVIPKEQPSSNPYVEEFSSGKFGTGTLEFMQFEKQIQAENGDPPISKAKQDVPKPIQDPFSDPMIVPKNLPKVVAESSLRNSSSEPGSYAQAYQQKRLEQI
mgnify:CR=1 FL=1